MQVEFINPFIESLANTFEVMLSCKTERIGLAVKDGEDAPHPVNGVIGLSGRIAGSVVLSLSEAVAVKAASTMLMTELTEVDEDVRDAVGELVNMVAGGAKAKLAQYDLCVGLPNVITGQDLQISFPLNTKPITISFNCAWGPLAVEIGFTESKD